MEKKKLKLSISGSSKKTINSIEQAKSQSKNTVVIEKKSIIKRDLISKFFLKDKNKVEKKLINKKTYKNTFSMKITLEILKFRDWNINIVSILWKSKGATIIDEPFKKNNISL